jgi:hypothetical protein
MAKLAAMAKMAMALKIANSVAAMSAKAIS